MDVRSNGSIWQVFAKFLQPQFLAGPQANQNVPTQTEQAVKAAVKVNRFTFDPNSPAPEGPVRRGMLVDIVV